LGVEGAYLDRHVPPRDKEMVGCDRPPIGPARIKRLRHYDDVAIPLAPIERRGLRI
jgi:hypothetical protein